MNSSHHSTANETNLYLKCLNVKFTYSFNTSGTVVNYFAVIFLLVIIPPTILLNAATLYVFSTRKVRRKMPTNILIFVSCMIDLLNGLVSMLTMVIHYSLVVIQLTYSCPLYIAMLSSCQCISWISAAMTLLISVDRYLAASYPYFYQHWCINKRKMYYMCSLVICIFGVSVVFISFLTVGFKPVLYMSGTIPIIIAVCFYTHCKIFGVVKRIQKDILKNSVSLKRYRGGGEKERGEGEGGEDRGGGCGKKIDGAFPVPVKTSFCQINKSRSKKQKQQQNRVTASNTAHRVSFLILCVLCQCYTPYFFLIIYWEVRLIKTGLPPNAEQYSAASVAAVLVLCRSCLNPCIYLYTMPSVRRKIFALIPCCRLVASKT